MPITVHCRTHFTDTTGGLIWNPLSSIRGLIILCVFLSFTSFTASSISPSTDIYNMYTADELKPFIAHRHLAHICTLEHQTLSGKSAAEWNGETANIWTTQLTISQAIHEAHPGTIFRNIAGGLHITSNTPDKIAKGIYRWARDGFPQRSDISFRQLKVIQAILMAWLFPPEMKKGRSNTQMWSLSCSIAQVLALHDLMTKGVFRRHLRVIMRGFGYYIHQMWL